MPTPTPMQRLVRLLAFAVVSAALVPLSAQDAQEAAAVRTASAAYKAALERGDGKALAALWAPGGDIIDAVGNLLEGRTSVEVLEPVAADAVSGAKPTFTSRETGLRFVAPGVAIEDGEVQVVPPGGAAPMHGRYSAVWVRHEGAWKLAALREAQGDQGQGVATLDDLAWMVGDWTVLDDGPAAAAAVPKSKIEMSVRWNPTHTFLLRDMTITPPGGAADGSIQISQRIGWDPLSKGVRSWVFSSDGGHGEASWSRDDGSWVARTTAVLPDGSQTSSLNIYTYDGKDRCVWRSLPTHVGGEHLPQVNMTLVRKPGTGTTEGAR